MKAGVCVLKDEMSMRKVFVITRIKTVSEAS